MRGADIMALQKDHDVFDLFLLLPAFFDPVHAEPADPVYLQQLLRILFDHSQRIFSESLDDPPGILRTDPFYKAAAEILFNAINCRRQRFLKCLHLKLPAIFPVDPPAPPEGQHTADMDIGHRAHNCHQLLKPLRPAFDHRIAVHGILVSDPFHNTSEMLHAMLTAFPFPSLYRFTYINII